MIAVVATLEDATVTAHRGYPAGGGPDTVTLTVEERGRGYAAEAEFTVEEFTQFARMLGIVS